MDTRGPSKRHWIAGLAAVLAFLAMGTAASASQGLSLKAGSVEMTVDVTGDRGLAIRFTRAA